LGRNSRSVQFVKFEHRLGEPLDALRAEFGLLREPCSIAVTPEVKTPELLRGVA
jgi:hypothetical protein